MTPPEKQSTPSRRIVRLLSRRVKKKSRTATSLCLLAYDYVLWYCQFDHLHVCCFIFDFSAVIVLLCRRSFVVTSTATDLRR